jgi:hypothetical protein
MDWGWREESIMVWWECLINSAWVPQNLSVLKNSVGKNIQAKKAISLCAKGMVTIMMNEYLGSGGRV